MLGEASNASLYALSPY